MPEAKHVRKCMPLRRTRLQRHPSCSPAPISCNHKTLRECGTVRSFLPQRQCTRINLGFGFCHLNTRPEAGVAHCTDVGTNNNASLTDQGCPVLHKRTGYDAAVKVYLTHTQPQCLSSTNFLLTLQIFVSSAYPRSRTHTHVISLSCSN
jgi:hypothetical protein